jgi:hypothetical protein
LENLPAFPVPKLGIQPKIALPVPSAVASTPSPLPPALAVIPFPVPSDKANAGPLPEGLLE